MKSIETVIHQLKLHEVRNALNEAGVEDYTESAILCHDHQERRTMMFRGAKFVADVVQKVKLEIVAADESVEKIIDAIRSREECRISVRPYPEAV